MHLSALPVLKLVLCCVIEMLMGSTTLAAFFDGALEIASALQLDEKWHLLLSDESLT